MTRRPAFTAADLVVMRRAAATLRRTGAPSAVVLASVGRVLVRAAPDGGPPTAELRGGVHKFNGARGGADAHGARAEVVLHVRAHGRPRERLGTLRATYDGTRADARRAAQSLYDRAGAEGYDMGGSSVLVAHDEGGAPRWLISPNLAVFTDADAPEAAPLLRFVGGASPRRAPAAAAAAPRPAAAAGRRPEVQLHVDYRPGGSRRRVAPLRAAYDGTREGARAAALGLQRRAADLGFEGAESVIVALDEGGDPRWVVSPNLAVFTPATAPGAAAPLRRAGFRVGSGARAASRGTKR